MPPKKQKKQPRNAFYFFMVERKQQLEGQGYRFPGGMKDVASSLAGEWASLPKEEKAPYEEEARIAKLEGKNDLTNKFTVTGESYAQVQQRVTEERAAAEAQENYITQLAVGDGALDRIFILIKTTHCVEEIVEKNRRIYWPLELSMAAFSVRDGLRSTYWTLIDTKKTPVGYASAAKETSEETCLPEPGSKMFSEDHRDYNKIMKMVKGFVEFWLKKGYTRGPVVFAMDQETNHARGCLDWLVDHMDSDKQEEYGEFLDRLKLYTLPKLILRFADYAHQLDPLYENVMTMYKLEHSAASIITKGCYDYRDEITCVFHKTEKASLKMPTCCRNIVLKRMFLMFEEFLPAFGLPKMERHDIDKLGKGPPGKPKPKASSSAASATKNADEKPEERDSWGRVIKPGALKPEQSKASQNSFRNRKEDDDPPSPSMMDNHDESEGFVPWGKTREAPSASFSLDDFPALGAGPGPALGSIAVGRGRGRGAPMPDEREDPDAPGRSYY